ncbi:uncharacterized protein G6M90_00g079280 [Metarhizium brunneum]|uniref:Uncharacterized protein n=1 Tax=Metarhizium brunneum TaxID=500148 RepID=A0A7D5V017_9HYPO|nr:hypothetical protein G6M90_00g079280 [Metarhizium brunneum]
MSLNKKNLSYEWESLLNFSLLFAKTATLLLLLQLFSVSKAMKIAIWAGIACTFVIYTSGLAVNSAVVASATSLVYRVKSIQDENPDLMYDAGVLLLCKFMRVHVLETRILKALQSSWGGSRSSSSRSDMANRKPDPNQPRTGREKRPNYKGRNYMETGDTWLLNSGARADVEAVKQEPVASNGVPT